MESEVFKERAQTALIELLDDVILKLQSKTDGYYHYDTVQSVSGLLSLANKAVRAAYKLGVHESLFKTLEGKKKTELAIRLRAFQDLNLNEEIRETILEIFHPKSSLETTEDQIH